MGKITGWDRNGRPFTKSEFNNSVIHATGGTKTYSEYLKDMAYIEKRNSAKSKPKPKKKKSSGFWDIGF
jgi:hypothetical protein